MREYHSHKKVKAAQIVEALSDRADGVCTGFLLDDKQVITAEEMAKLHRPDYTPSTGDYLVEYEDGYRSVSPQKAFEDGYTPIYASLSSQATVGDQA